MKFVYVSLILHYYYYYFFFLTLLQAFYTLVRIREWNLLKSKYRWFVQEHMVKELESIFSESPPSLLAMRTVNQRVATNSLQLFV